MANKKMPAMQQLFVVEYLVDLNATQAAIRAGYSEKTAGSQGERLLKNVEIAARIQKAMDKRVFRTEITADYVLQGIVEVVERCKQGVPVRDNEGNETGEWKFEPNAALKGYELLGKNIKLFTDKVEHTGQMSATAVLLMPPDEAYKRLLEGGGVDG